MTVRQGFAQGLVGLPAEVAKYMPRAYSVTLSPAAVAPGTAEQTFTVTGLTTDDLVSVNKPTQQANLGIAGCRVSAADTLAITFINAPGTAITSLTAATSVTPTASEEYTVIAIRCATRA
ncbi:MAG: hypothetical protein NUW01_07135 [Gemmatimonadaceae bacterium]|nr:hypothetical protein [Gemmatimonadaceae bacterium]